MQRLGDQKSSRNRRIFSGANVGFGEPGDEVGEGLKLGNDIIRFIFYQILT